MATPISRRTLIGAGGLTALAAAGGGLGWTARHRRLDFLCQTVAFDGSGQRVMIGPEDAGRLVPGSRVLAGTAGTDAQLTAERTWLARARLPAAEQEDLTRSALQDLRVLTLPDGAALAGWPTIWHYVWPRDASFTAVALAVAGFHREAVAVLTFLARAQNDDGTFSARYLVDGSGPPDARPRQSDGLGWVCWAAGVLRRLGVSLPGSVHGMVQRSVAVLAAGLDRLTDLPAVSPDWWEVAETQLTLGIAAAQLIGLEHAAALDVPQAAEAADRLCPALFKVFLPAFGRHVGGEDPDASLTFLLPPFRTRDQHTDTVRDVLLDAMNGMHRDAGGYAPGTGWKRDGISWTPTTSLLALAWAGLGERERATTLLGWLAGTRTAAGSFPEKVLYDGSPAGPAPLSWTVANVVLTQALLTPGLAGWAA